MRATLGELAERTPDDAEATLREAAAQARGIASAVQDYDLGGTVGDKGFDKGEVLRYFSARDELITGMTLYREAALLGAVAAELDQDVRGRCSGARSPSSRRPRRPWGASRPTTSRRSARPGSTRRTRRSRDCPA